MILGFLFGFGRIYECRRHSLFTENASAFANHRTGYPSFCLKSEGMFLSKYHIGCGTDVIRNLIPPSFLPKI